MQSITPQEFLIARASLEKVLANIWREIDDLKEMAIKCPLPGNLRPAEASDIFEGAIIWYPKSGDSITPYWHVVRQVLCPSDKWKAYESSDGTRRGLHGAFVEFY